MVFLEDIEGIIDELGITDGKIEKLQSKKKLKNKDIMSLILTSLPTINANVQRLSLNHQQTLTQLQSNMEAK